MKLAFPEDPYLAKKPAKPARILARLVSRTRPGADLKDVFGALTED